MMGCGVSKITAIESATTQLGQSEDNQDNLVKNLKEDEVKIDHPNSNVFNSRQRLLFKHRLSSIHESVSESSNPIDTTSVGVQKNLENYHQLTQTDDDLETDLTSNQSEFEQWLKTAHVKSLNPNSSIEDVDLNIIKRIRTIGSSVVYDVGIQAAPSKRAMSTQTFTNLIKPKLNTIPKDYRPSLQLNPIEESSDQEGLASDLVEDHLKEVLDNESNSSASIITPFAHVEDNLSAKLD